MRAILRLGASLVTSALIAGVATASVSSQGGAETVTALPQCTTAIDGKVVNFQPAAFAADGLMWRFRCNGTSSSVHRWEFVGGGDLRAEVATDESIAAGTTTYVDLATVGPSLTVPLSGDYVLEYGARAYPWAQNQTLYVSYDIGPLPAADGDAVMIDGVAQRSNVGSRTRSKTLGAGQAIVMKYRKTSNIAQGNFAQRYLSLRPVRVASAGGAPLNVADVEMSGTFTVGEIISANAGTWGESPTSYVYQWQRCNSSGAACASVGAPTTTSSAQAPNYNLMAVDGGQTLRLQVSATNAYGTTVYTSPPSAVIGGAIPTSGLQVYLDASRTLSYRPGVSGNTWSDLSGNGRTFTWDAANYAANGQLSGFTTWGRTATGPASNSFGMSDNVGYTVLMVARQYSWQNSGGFKFYGSGGYSRGVFGHWTWSDQNYYFDQGGCCGTDTRTWSGSGTNTSSYYLSGVTRNGYYDRRIWRGNGNQLAYNGNWTANMSLDGRGAQIGPRDEGYGWDAHIVAFMVYSRALSQAEISTIYWAFAGRGIAN